MNEPICNDLALCKVSAGPNPMNSLQACIDKDFTCIRNFFVILQSYETFLLVFAKKFYKDLAQVKRRVKTSKFRKI